MQDVYKRQVYIHNYMNIGEGTIIYEGVILTANIEVGKHVIISPKCGIGHDSIIKDYVSLLWKDVYKRQVLLYLF